MMSASNIPSTCNFPSLQAFWFDSSIFFIVSFFIFSLFAWHIFNAKFHSYIQAIIIIIIIIIISSSSSRSMQLVLILLKVCDYIYL